MQPFTLNIRGILHHYQSPAVMGIINCTPDSFYEKSRALDAAKITEDAAKMVAQGAKFLDVGAYSSRPGHDEVSIDEELRRLSAALDAVRRADPDIPVSVDTFRADVAREAVTNLGADIVNDVTGGSGDERMFETIADLRVPYVLMHMRGTLHTMQQHTDYDDLLADVMCDMAHKIEQLELLGVNDIIIDPGFGFSKTLEQNYQLLKNLSVFEIFHMPILVGVSRKSMITKLLDVSAENALEGTTAINICALHRGASILRVHDVEPAMQAIKIFQQL